MGSGMNTEQAKEYAKTMTYSEAVANVKYSKGIKYRKATMIKLRELAEIADRLDKADTSQTMYYPQVDGITPSVIVADTPQTEWTQIECYDGCEWPVGSPQCEGCDRLPPQTDCGWK